MSRFVGAWKRLLTRKVVITTKDAAIERDDVARDIPETAKVWLSLKGRGGSFDM